MNPLSYIKLMFTYVPYAVLIVTVLVFVLRLRAKWWAKLAWTGWLAFCCSKFLVFQKWGGETFVPDLPEKTIWFWNWAYSGAMILCLLSVVFFFGFRRKGLVLALAAWGLSSWGLWCGVKVPLTHELELAYADLPEDLDGYRIVHLSDLHASSAARLWRTRAVVDAVNALRPDLVCLTGDYVDGDPGKWRDLLSPLKNLRARDGVWAVSGNHEWFDWHAGWWKIYDELGIRFLANACVFPRRSLALGGVHDFRILHPVSGELRGAYPDVGKTFSTATNGEFRILMQHQPREAHANLVGHGVRLQLSGHTHGGIAPGMSEVVKASNGGYVRGVYSFGSSRLYVTTGCGQWPGFPMRFFDPSEIAVITLRRRSP